MGPELGGKHFEEVFETKPKWVQLVDSCWVGSATGVFGEFETYVRRRLADPLSRGCHERRCQEFVKTLKPEKIPEYLKKFVRPPSPSKL